MASSVLSVVLSWDLSLKTMPKIERSTVVTAPSQAKVDTDLAAAAAASSGRTEQA
jgi:hypothetical protein